MTGPLPSALDPLTIIAHAYAALDAEQDPAVLRAWTYAFDDAARCDAMSPPDFPLPDYHQMVVAMLLGARARA